MSQERLAELVDLNVRNIQWIEAGEITILITTAERLRAALKCSWDQMLGS
jgi:transcriptional regulator with XRE-family HTH domain